MRINDLYQIDFNLQVLILLKKTPGKSIPGFFGVLGMYFLAYFFLHVSV